MPEITKAYQRGLQDLYDHGLLTDEKMLKGLCDVLKKLDRQLSAWGGTEAAIQTLEALAEELERQSGIRIDPGAAAHFAWRYRHHADQLREDLPR
jgi:hypothetical protein